jgi:hypothetical protein
MKAIHSHAIPALGLALLLGSPLAAATFTVTNTFDSGPGSLRDAILLANANPGPDLITFSIPGPGPHTITPLSCLPALWDPGTTIDGFTQPGAAPGGTPPATAVLLIEIDGTLAGGCDGLRIESDNNVVQGLVVNRFQRDGIHIEGGVFNVMGGVLNPSANLNRVYANFVGTDPSGTLDLGNGTSLAALQAGIHVGNVAGGNADFNTIDANLSSGNWSDGIWIAGPIQPGSVGSNMVLSNRVGTDVSGTLDLGNDHEGIALTEGTVGNQVLFNLASGNDYDGIGLQGFDNAPFPQPPILTSGNLISGNVVGLDWTATAPLPNTLHGITLGTYGPTVWGCAPSNSVTLNTVAFNGRDGIAVVEHSVDPFNADHNRISQNSIHDNGHLGIDLQDDGVTPNDPFDLDTGPNEGHNFPVVTSARTYGGLTELRGTLDDGGSEHLAVIEVFKASLDPSGHGEGEVYLGSTVPAPGGVWKVSVPGLAVGDLVTVTATGPGNNTSEFSLAVTVRPRKFAPHGPVTNLPVDVSAP